MRALERYRIAFREKFRSVFREEFQVWVETLLRALHETGDLQIIRQTSGDGGIDAFAIDSQIVYQVYAPTRISELRDGETAAKIDADFSKAIKALAGDLMEWVFVHNHPDGRIGRLTANVLSTIRKNHPSIKIVVLDINTLWERLAALRMTSLDKLFGPGGPPDHDIAVTNSDSNPAVVRSLGKGGVLRNCAAHFIFLQFPNLEIRDLYQSDKGRNPRQLLKEWLRISKYALLVSENGLAFPASYLFEVPEFGVLLEELQAVRKLGLLHVMSPTRDLVVYAGEKRNEYRDEPLLFSRYDADEEEKSPNGQLLWIPRIERSASRDISAAWRNELDFPSGFWPQILQKRQNPQMELPSILESAIYSVPDRLEGRAFIYRFAKQLLPFVMDTASETRLKLLLSREYLRSYLLELRAAIIVETTLGDLSCGLEKYSPGGALQTISWRAVHDSFETLGIRPYVEAMSWREFLQFRVQPVLHWLLEMVLTPAKAGRNVFEQVVTLSGFRVQDSRFRGMSTRPYDIVMERIWRFQSAAGPVLSSYDWTEIAVDWSRPSLPPKRRIRRARESKQLTMLKDSCDIGIVVALPDEFRELQRQLAHRWTPLFDKDTATYYYLFTCESASGEPPYTCVAAFAGSMGPTKAALLTERLRVRWGVATVINVGIAGALDDDVHLTDVVVGSVADNYLERAKAVDSTEGDGFDFDLSGEPFRSSHALINACVNLEFANSDLFTEWRRSCALALSGLPMAERERLNNEGLIATSSLVVSGHIACGPSVGASVAFKRWLKRRDRSYLALDMESGGVLQAVYEATRSTDGLIIRGISDFADERKKELDKVGKGELRRCAMHNALLFLWSLMKAGRMPHVESE